MSRNAVLRLVPTLLVLACLVLPVSAAPRFPGVVVDEVGAGSALEKAGIRPGDVLLAWRRPPRPSVGLDAASGPLTSVFDWSGFVFEQTPRGAIELTVERGGGSAAVTVTPGLWSNVRVRPRMSAALVELYLEGEALLVSGDRAGAAARWQEVAASAEARADWRLRCWSFLHTGRAWRQAREWDKAHAALRAALDEARAPAARAAVWRAVAKTYENAGDFERAQEAYETVPEVLQSTGGESLNAAVSLAELGLVAWRQGRLDQAQGHFERVFEIRRRLAPKSLSAASSLNHLGLVALQRGELDRAADAFERALEVWQRLAPGSLDMAANLTNLGIVARQRSLPERAAEYHRRALEIHREQAPGGIEEAASLDNLGSVARDRGELETAAEYHERALAIRRRIAPDSHEVAMSFNNLGTVAGVRGELEQAADLFARALAIWRRRAPDSLYVAAALNNLGDVARYRGELERSAAYHLQALELRRRLAPGSLQVAMSLINLGTLALDRGDLQAAREHFVRALAIQQERAPGARLAAITLDHLGTVASRFGEPGEAREDFASALAIHRRLAPGGLEVARSLRHLGILHRDHGEPERAAEALGEALAIEQRLAPGSFHQARTLHALGTLHRRRGEPRPALDAFRRAVAILENQVGRIGGSPDVQAGFRARYLDLYRDTLELELELDEPEAAFHTLERSRAWGFLALLAERDTVFAADIPAELDRDRRHIARRYDLTFERLARLHPTHDAAQIEELRLVLGRLRAEADDVALRIRRGSPRLAALRYPEPLGLRGARQVLDPGTVLLAYSVGEERTHLFVVDPERGLSVEALAIGEDELRREVELFERLIPQALPGDPFGDAALARLGELGGRLYELLVGPAADRVARAERLLILPDGPLHLLPFGALRRGVAGHGEYLAEWKPLHLALSATVYGELGKSRRHEDGGEAPLHLVAFGDPSYPRASREKGGVVDVQVRSAVERGLLDWGALPHSRGEVERIVALYPSGAAHSYLGPEATEERVKSSGAAARILHIAAHGYLDERVPLDSFVALAIPRESSAERDNGLLQAWEVFEQVRLDADLVVLSACRSGRGLELGGEGLIGLTRAFQYAGARSVVAALWNVSDRGTTELMVRFYRHLHAGVPKDTALQAAQVELIRAPLRMMDERGRELVKDASAPYYWAAFQLYGDWR